MKRNLLQEINSVKSRIGLHTRYDFGKRLNDIEYIFQNNNSSNTELLRYIPIAIVACFEAYFRSTYKELIDSGTTFSKNVVKFNQAKNIKFDFEIVNAVQAKKLTIGEFIAHILPCNNYKDINSNLSTIINSDFTKEIKSFKRKSISEDENKTSKFFIENSVQIISDLNKIFELRHIFCHEFATNFKIKEDEIFRCFSNAKLFLHQTDNFIEELLHPNSRETQSDINIKALEDFRRTEKELERVVESIKKDNKNIPCMVDIKLFDKALKTWKKYREDKAKLDASIVKGGTMYQSIYLNSSTAMTEEKIESLQKEFNLR